MITTEFTGYYDSTEGEYIYPSAQQDFLLFNGISKDFAALTEVPPYLSALDSDFSSDGVTLTRSTGASENISVGNVTSAVLSGTILNEGGLLDEYEFSSLCQAWIGVVTGTESVTMPDGASCYIDTGDHVYYAIGDQGYKDGTSLGFTGGADIVSLTFIPGEDTTEDESVTFWCEDGSKWTYTDASHVVPPGVAGWAHSVATQDFTTDKYTRTPQSILFPSYTSTDLTVKRWNVETQTLSIWEYIPMGVFDFSRVAVYGTAYTFEVYDKGALFDGDASGWIASVDFSAGVTVVDLIDSLMSHLGYGSSADPTTCYYIIDAGAVNLACQYTHNVFDNGVMTYRQVLQQLAEVAGCNVRLNGDGYVYFYAYTLGTSVMNVPTTITPNTIISKSRTVDRYIAPRITRIMCYKPDGTLAPLVDEGDGATYVVLGNGLVTDADGGIGYPPQQLYYAFQNIPTYYPGIITDACADPRIDPGIILDVTRADGTTYKLPVMHQTLTWNGMCVAEYEATYTEDTELSNATAMAAYEAKAAGNQLKDYVQKTGDTMTGNLVVDTGSTRRTTIGTGSVKVENTSDTTQNTTQYYNGIVSTNGTNTATLLPTGLSLDGTILTSAIGSNTKSPAATVDVPSGAYTETASFTLTPGVYIIECFLRFAANATGRRVFALSQTSASGNTPAYDYAEVVNAVNGAATTVRIVVIRSVGQNTTLYMNAYQNSGSTLSTNAIYAYVRIL